MDELLIGEIQSFTLKARDILEREADEQLQGIFGWLPDGSFADAKPYPAVVHLAEARETRQRLERFAEDEKIAGFNAKAARAKLIRETAFTWLNRFVAFRLMEERKLLKQTLAKLDRSNGFIFWLTDDANKDAYALHQQGGLPLNAMGEGPSDVAYRQFILWQCGELARDVSVLFDSATVASRLFPRPPVLKQLIAKITAEALTPAWQPGNEETIGWVYEGFIEDENKVVFDKFSKGKKVQAEEIAAATQRFTPRWIVRFLVENSLGRLWIEMHPDSRLKDSLSYLVPVDKAQPRPLKLAREVSFLDPCCGSMHFGLLAFDLFDEIYREELDRAGQTGWPVKASVQFAEDISASIIAHNLHGIDIDLRAVQIAAFALLIKARTMNPNAAFTDLNLACANVEQISGGKLDAFIAQAKFSHPIYERILHSLSARMKNSEHVGSLLRLEKTLENLIADERRKAEADKQFALSFPGLSTEQFKTHEGIEEFFAIISDQVLRHLDQFVRASRASGNDPGHFVNEAAKGLRYMRLVSSRYDVVATNPPYMSRRNMSEAMKDYLDAELPKAKGDLYAAFILRCVQLAAHLGKMAMVTQHSFMFISSYEDLRKELRSTVAIETMVHLGPKAFPNITGEKVSTTAFVFRLEADTEKREENVGSYFRLVKEPEADRKRQAFEAGLAARRDHKSHTIFFCCTQKGFNDIPEQPWIYCMRSTIRNLFKNLGSLHNHAAPRAGLQTGDNTRFVRKWWEIGKGNISFGCVDRKAALASMKKWFPYMKGGTAIPWYGNQEHVVNWNHDGKEIEEFRPRAVIRNSSFYFRRGITWSDVSTKRFAGRLSPGGFIFDVKGSSLFPTDPDLLLPVLNSSFAEYILRLLNPTASFQVGDLERLPVPKTNSQAVTGSAQKAVELVKQDSRESERTYDFVQPIRNSEDYYQRKETVANIEVQIDGEVSRLYGLNDKDLAAIKQELSSMSAAEEGSDSRDEEEESDTEVTPGSVAQSWISYALGTVLGRFEIGTSNGFGRGDFLPGAALSIRKLFGPDGIMPSDPNHPQDLVKRILLCLELMLGRDEAPTTIRAASGDEGDPEDILREWIDGQFWKYHSQLYRKRPVYWPLQSPKKKFTVWVFHERFTKDTLFHIRRNIVEVRLRLLEREIADKRKEAATNKAAAKQLDKLRDLEDDLREFSKRLKEVADRGYTPHIDDGVLINAAPLHSLLPSWPETKKAWQELENEEYEWAQQAMEYWPDRVKKKCKTNKSFAIAHGLA